jgi:hypothetical protein
MLDVLIHTEMMARGLPIDGVVIPDESDKTSWRIYLTDESFRPQVDEFIETFDLAAFLFDLQKREAVAIIYAWFAGVVANTGVMPGGEFSAEMVSDIAFILLEIQQVGGDLSQLNPITLSRIEAEAAAFQPQPLTADQLVYVWSWKHLEMRQATAPLIAKRRELLDRLKLATTPEELEVVLSEL